MSEHPVKRRVGQDDVHRELDGHGLLSRWECIHGQEAQPLDWVDQVAYVDSASVYTHLEPDILIEWCCRPDLAELFHLCGRAGMTASTADLALPNRRLERRTSSTTRLWIGHAVPYLMHNQ